MASLILVACGGSDDEEAASDDRAATSSSTTTTSPTAGEDSDDSGASTSTPSDDEGAGGADESDDRAIAEGAVLQLSDFEPGWRADEPDPDDDEADIDDCEGFESFDDDTPSADSKTFVREETEIESSVAVLPTPQEAEGFMRLLEEESTVECLRQAVQDAADEGFQEDADLQAQFDSVSSTVGPVSVGEYGDDAAGYQIEATFEGEELTLDVYVDLLVVREGRALALFSFVDVFTPFSGERDALVEAVVDRLAAAGV